MPHPCGRKAMGRVRRAAVWSALLVATGFSAGGCVSPGQTPAPPPAEQMNMETRARDLLLEGARSDLDVIACNSIEALVRTSPNDGLIAFRNALHSQSRLVRFAGCVAVGEVRDRGAQSGILRCLNDDDPRVQLGAAFAACRLGDAEQGRVLADSVLHGKDDHLRCDAAFLIGRLGDREALKWLRAAAELPDVAKSRRLLLHIYAAMAELGDGEGLARLVEYSYGDAESRVIALQALALLGREGAREALLYTLNDPGEYIEARLLAARGLGRIGSRAGYALSMESLGFDRQNADDPNEIMRIRGEAAMALGDIGDPRALPALCRLAGQESDERIQVAACYAICQITRANALRTARE